MGVNFRENNGNPYYDIHYRDLDDKPKHATVYISAYGKYAEDVANYIFNNHIRINNWFLEKDDNIIELIHYNKSDDSYDSILIDKDDYNKVSQYYWSTEESSRTKYAITKINKNTKLRMHRILTNAKDSSEIPNHIDGNGLNNRKNNLELANTDFNNKHRTKLQRNNNTGLSGVARHKNRHGTFIYDVTWTDPDTKKTKHKSFSVNKYGEDEAKRLAFEFRTTIENKYGITRIEK